MEALTKLALAAVDLAEAELASLQRGTIRLAIAIAAVFGGAVLVIAGVWLLLWSAYRGLQALIGPIGALAITGALFALIGGTLVLLAWKRISSKGSPTNAGPRQPSDVSSDKRAAESAARKREQEAAFAEGRTPKTTSAAGTNDDPSSLRIAS